jgi:hypothetical protein
LSFFETDVIGTQLVVGAVLQAPGRALHPYLELRGLWHSSIRAYDRGSSTQSHHPLCERESGCGSTGVFI